MTITDLARGMVAGCAVPSTDIPAEPVADLGVVLVLSGMRKYPSVMRLVRWLGDELFPPGAYRFAATALATGSQPEGSWLSRADRALLPVIRRDLARTTIPHTEEWALRLVQIQAERRFQHLLAAALRWAADQVETGKRIDFIRRFVTHAFDIAEGLVPLDPVQPWEPTQ